MPNLMAAALAYSTYSGAILTALFTAMPVPAAASNMFVTDLLAAQGTPAFFGAFISAFASSLFM